MRIASLLVCLLATPGALACGGLFCNANTPVNQAAERILFAHHEGQIEMHVRLTYAGPPTDFGWILPVPRDVETEISSEALFRGLDAAYGPQFRLQTEYADDCQWPEEEWADAGLASAADGGAGGAGGAGDPAPPRVQVLSREAIGPYDRVILDAQDVGALRDWLDDNEFAIPDTIDEKLSPYIELDAVFVAIKLLAGSDSGDIVPLRLTFTGDRPAIPIIPTAVAAENDVGVIVHVLGETRAIPLNYLHVVVNEAAIDWQNSGDNYADVVSAAADEAGGRAFATDYAGPLTDIFTDALAPFDEGFLDQLAQVETVDQLWNIVRGPVLRDPDFSRVMVAAIEIPEGVDPSEFAGCPSCYMEPGMAFPGAAIAERLREEVKPVREHLAELFDASPYLTRLYTTMSADEMDTDPVFSFNNDLEQQSNQHVAIQRIECPDGSPDWENPTIVLPDGSELPGDAEPIRRENGENVRGLGTQAAALVEQLPEAGPGTEVSRMPPRPPAGSGGGGGGSAGCVCDVGEGGGPESLLGFVLLALTGLRRRR